MLHETPGVPPSFLLFFLGHPLSGPDKSLGTILSDARAKQARVPSVNALAAGLAFGHPAVSVLSVIGEVAPHTSRDGDGSSFMPDAPIKVCSADSVATSQIRLQRAEAPRYKRASPF
jgi:hypothetical protein